MKLFLKTKDFSISGEEFELHYDELLDMLVTSPQPEKLEAYYKSEAYISHTDADTTLTDKLYQRVKKYSLRKKVALIGRYLKKDNSLLDIGAGTGDFLVAAKEAGWGIKGVEPSVAARKRAEDKGIELKADLELLKHEKFGVITLWHVLEHLPDLELQISKIVTHLEEEATLIIAVPNFKSKDAEHYEHHWAAYDVPRHLWHFSRNSIVELFAKHELKLIETRPMIFDAFYVALLSEKYKNGNTGFFTLCKAFGVGLWSNLSAWRTKEYSSLIYILKKD